MRVALGLIGPCLQVLLVVACLVAASGCIPAERRDISAFESQRARYSEAAAWATAHRSEARYPESHTMELDLPERYRGLSEGGTVSISGTGSASVEVTFFTSRGLLGTMRGLVYTSSDTTPQADSVRRLDRHWFWVRSE